jgi:ADP-ribose pyrophosphatase YjhB (NUDIX family)
LSRRFPARPFVGVGAIVFDRQRVLLIERGTEPWRGWWTVPGGMVELGERLEEAVARETREETGLHVRPVAVAAVFEHITPGAGGGVEFHHVILDYWCELLGGELHAASDVSAAGWFDAARMATMPLAPGTLEVIGKARRMAARGARE